ncbi:hypothetical protein ESOMN_v1c02820 [Williamsoniiplasma somnilux]|uniref:Uncharacterized protein n=1 Tax=Williamsoniiplasma somnilux TaxID=215578 RepID=A0A2K8NY46_9MOLU|nr:hypothetical protein [Williamsoniiplasma somnilux]ATZ18664.1 hypothetical protein ESOMN_v1c02820 [Williamsoniiplasma somnilux]
MSNENNEKKSKFKGLLLLLLLFIPIATTTFVVFQLSQRNIKNILEIKNELQEILDKKLNQKWQIEELQKEIDKKWGTGQITVKFVPIIEYGKNEAFNNVSNISFHKPYNDIYTFIGNASRENDFTYNGSINLIHSYSDINAKIRPISDIETYLQRILDSRKGKVWSKTELEQEVVNRGLDVKGGILVEEINVKNNRSSETKSRNTTWKFIGQADDNNDFHFNASISLEHSWNNKIDTTENIRNKTTITKLQNLLDSKNYKNKTWTAELLKNEIVKQDIDVSLEFGGITVQEVETTLETRSFTGGQKVTTWKFTGHGNLDNNGRYYGNVTLNHEWNDTKDTTQEINVIKDELIDLVNSIEYKNKNWTKDDLQDAINAKWVGAGITVEEKLVSQTRSWDEKQQTTIWTFTGNGDVTNQHPYKNTVDIKHNWVELISTTKNIEEIKSELVNILNEKKENAWSQEELQTKVDELYGTKEITVIDPNENNVIHYSMKIKSGKSWIFRGNGEKDSTTNKFKYYGEESITHEWFETISNTISVKNLKDDLQILLDSQSNKQHPWDILKLQNALDNKYGANAIIVNISQQKIPNESGDHYDKYKFTGKSIGINGHQYIDEIELIHIWNPSIK